MAKPKNFELMSKIEEFYHRGLSDGKIAKQLGVRLNVVHWYRFKVLKLSAHQTKRQYVDQHSKLKGYIIRGVKSSAKRRGIEFNLHPEDFEIVENCPIFGEVLSYKNFFGKSDSNSDFFATMDRKDPSKGYVPGNVWIISRLANNMKSSASPDQLFQFSQFFFKEYDIV